MNNGHSLRELVGMMSKPLVERRAAEQSTPVRLHIDGPPPARIEEVADIIGGVCEFMLERFSESHQQTQAGVSALLSAVKTLKIDVPAQQPPDMRPVAEVIDQRLRAVMGTLHKFSEAKPTDMAPVAAAIDRQTEAMERQTAAFEAFADSLKELVGQINKPRTMREGKDGEYTIE